MSFTKRDSDYIGSEFITPKGGVFKAVGVSQRKGSNGSHYHTWECSICSKDKELFPKPFELQKGQPERGHFPCGCSKATHWDKEQYLVLLSRICNENNYSFLGFQGEWKRGNTLVSLHCNEDDCEWVASIKRIINGKTGCSSCQHTSNRKTDEDSTKDFMSTGKFPEGSKFKRSVSNPSWIDMYCPVCSNDEYVKVGLCSGIFSASRGSFHNGNLPCRCSKVYKYTREQREYLISKTLQVEGGSFIVWCNLEEWEGSDSCFTWVCDKGHTAMTSVDKFLSGRRCATCNTGTLGYYPERKYEKDNLYLIKLSSDSEEFIKIGRTFDIERRLNKNHLGKFYSPEIVCTHAGFHENIYKHEQEVVHRYYDSRYVPEVIFPGSVEECFPIHLLEDIKLYFKDLKKED